MMVRLPQTVIIQLLNVHSQYNSQVFAIRVI